MFKIRVKIRDVQSLIGKVYRFHRNDKTWVYTKIEGGFIHWKFLTNEDGVDISKMELTSYVTVKMELLAIAQGLYVCLEQ